VPQCESCVCEYGGGDYCFSRGTTYLSGTCESSALYHCVTKGLDAILKEHCLGGLCTEDSVGLDHCTIAKI
jgi:hypothetical protein